MRGTNQKGITLIALIITIIIMIVLVAVTISITLGENGIIQKAKIASRETQMAADREELLTSVAAAMVDNIRVDAGFLINDLGNAWTHSGNSFPYTFTKTATGNSFTVAENGTVAYIGTEEVEEIEEAAAIPQLFLYEVIDENSVKVTGINYDFIYRDVQRYNNSQSGYNYSESGSDYNGNDSGSALYEIGIANAEALYLTNVVIPSKVKLDSNGKYNEEGTEYNVTSIGYYAFKGCNKLKNVTISNSVTNIENYAFSECYRGLTNVIIGNSVTSIGNYAFDNCHELTNVTMTNSVTSIGECAFYNCHALTSITISNSLTSIGDYAFYDCDSLTNITIPSSVTSIGQHAFCDCDSLTSITIPASVISIGYDAFIDSDSLTSITVNSDNIKYSSEDGVLFNKEKTELIFFPDGKAGISYTIPNTVTNIGKYAFSNCSSLTSITIPNSVTSIGSGAFFGCSNLTNVYYRGTEEEWNSISIDNTYYSNSQLINANKVYNYTGE